MDQWDLQGRVVLVTGASSGIGAATARLAHAAGAVPVLAARRADRLHALAAELGGALAVPTDMTDRPPCALWPRRRWSATAGSTPWSTTPG